MLTCRPLLFAGALAVLAVPVSANTLVVPGSANIFGAGHAAPPEPGSGGAGSLPPTFSFAALGGQVLTFSGVFGSVSCCNSAQTGPDGGPFASGTTDITSYGGIAGVIDSQHTMFLVGVFLDASEPADPAPACLDFSTGQLGENFVVLAPAIGQVFYIGDGLTGTGTGATQSFLVPATATRLQLGFADAQEFGDPTSAPGFYGDNTGQVTAIFDVVPPLVVPTLPASWGRLKISYR
jgi:hypothetical protein